MSKPEIIVSSNSGFCFGVRRALGIAERSLKEHRRVYSLGPIIHNPQVVEEFSKKGLKIIKDVGRIKSPENTAVLFPSHGVDERILKKKEFPFIDTTCPLVGKVRELVRDLKKKGYFIIIVGDKNHPEVKGLVSLAGRGFSRVVKDRKEAKLVKANLEKVALLSQTTASLSEFRGILSEVAKKNFAELASFNTVCKNTVAREAEAERIAKEVDAMIVIGGKQSANTSKLAKVCKAVNKNTCRIESKKDLKKNFLKDKKKIGIATGASTPPQAIREVIKRIRGLKAND